ncbi:MAG: acylphosphatase [Candidatus Omnitrophota bacterium]
MKKSEKKRIHVFVGGRVQGVGFRYYTQKLAQSMGLAGEVKNVWDGRVEIVAEGEESVLLDFLEKIKAGPTSLSYVAKMDVDWTEAYGHYKEFSITF